MLQEELEKGQTWLKLFLRGGRPECVQFPLHVPAGYLPHDFRVVDACVTNAGMVWLWKHFYL
jgi:hypothetical protein